jgi:hypothetical protein
MFWTCSQDVLKSIHCKSETCLPKYPIMHDSFTLPSDGKDGERLKLKVWEVRRLNGAEAKLFIRPISNMATTRSGRRKWRKQKRKCQPPVKSASWWSMARSFRSARAVLYGEELTSPSETPSWKTTHCRLSEIAYSIHMQLPSTSGHRLLHSQPKFGECLLPGSSTHFVFHFAI